MLKVLIMAVAIFVGMIAYDHMDTPQKNTPPDSAAARQEEKRQQQMESRAVKGIFLTLLPDKSEWPEPFQKAWLAFNMEEAVEPLRESPDWVPLDAIPRDMQHALIAIEDHDFYNHGAIAVDGIIRAALVNISAGEVVQGGSTLTQQFVKNVFLTHEQSMERKIEEAVLSLMLEDKYSKDEILELYLNTTYFGAGADGLKQAAMVYFNKSPQALTLAEAAIIASLPYAPSALNPLENPAGCKKRQLLVLDAMQRYGFINQEQAAEARAEKVQLANGTWM